jgi:hypothetical protein
LEIEKRPNFKDVKVNGRNFRVKKFDALTGSYIAYRLMAEALPMGVGKAVGIPESASPKAMSKQDFIEIQKDCLRVCFEILPAGETCVMGENGQFAASGLEEDASTVLALTVHSIMHNVSGFFGEGLLDSIAKGMSSISQQDART